MNRTKGHQTSKVFNNNDEGDGYDIDDNDKILPLKTFQ